MMWATYEHGIEERYTTYEMRLLYELTVDKSEYPDFDGWLWDMERSATFYRHE